MPTFDPQLILTGVNILALGINLLLTIKVLSVFGQSRHLVKGLSDTKLDLADLTDRFTNFQKRDGMRQARAAKEGDGDLLQELQGLAKASVEGSQSGDVKAQLRRKARGLN